MESEYKGTEYKYNEATVRFYDIVYDQLAYNEREGGARAKFYLEEIAKVKAPYLKQGSEPAKYWSRRLKTALIFMGLI